jgi:DNA polymerase I-like protein with 3'-5' exonuclease and polymerase domains
MLAHFLSRWDGGAYGRVVCEGDVHTVNQEAAGLETRNVAKTFIYAFLYGAGDWKIGHTVSPFIADLEKKHVGKKLKDRFTQRTPGLEQLLTAVKDAAKRGYLVGLDGRHLHIRSDHAALNTLPQSAGALICKRWMVEIDLELTRRSWHDKVQQLLWVHDELQFQCDPDIADAFGKVAVECIGRAAEYFGIRVPLTGEYKIGSNWAECH